MSERRPPLLPRLFLGLVLPDSVREGYLGDLEERFRRQAEDDPAAARRRYWKDAFSPSLVALRREARGMPLPPGSRPTSARGDGLMSKLAQDLRYAVRMMTKAPAFTAVAVLSLALGIGPNAAVFSLVSSLLYQDWGVPEPERVVDVYSLTDDGRYFFTGYRVYELLQEGADDAFSDVAATAMKTYTLEVDGEPELALGEMVTGNYFDVLGVPALRGRTFLPEEDATPGTHPVVILSESYWRSRYGADPGLVGDEVRLNGRPYTVVGIAPASFTGRTAPGVGTDFWVPVHMYPHLSPGQMTGVGDMFFTARLRPGVTTSQAQAVLDAVARRYNEQRPESRSQLALGAVNLADVRLNPNFDGFLAAVTVLLFAAVGLVLLVACVNLAGFFLARATDRSREMAVRRAMGASRKDIVRQLLVESLLLASVGGTLGLALGVGVSRLLVGIEPPVDIPLSLEVALDWRVLLFTLGVSVLAAVAFGLTPALQAARAPVASTLRDESGAAGGRRKGRARGVLVVAQMALSTVLLFGSALFLRSLDEATALEVGFETGPAAVVQVEPWASSLEGEAEARFVDELARATAALPGVERSGITTRLPLDLGQSVANFDVPGVEPPPDQDRWRFEFAAVSSGYLEAMGISLVEGRGFREGEGAEGEVGILSREAAERLWPGESAVGRVLYRGGDTERPLTVIGVAEDAKIWSLTEPPRPYLYLPLSQASFGRYSVVARGALPPMETARRIQEAAVELHPEILVTQVGTMDDHLAYIYFLPRAAALLLLVVGGLAVAMACVGLYGMVSYSVARRTREMGIRMALGAERGRVVGLLVRGGLVLVAVGGAVGLGAAMVAGRAVQPFLIGVQALDPLALAGAPLVLAALAGLAAWLPARRAARVDPVEALRSE